MNTHLSIYITLLVCATIPCSAALKAYVDKPDDSYAYEVVQTQALPDGGTSRTIHMTSQTWNGMPWVHWMYIISPPQIEYPGKAILIIAGGSNREQMPRLPKEIRMIAAAVNTIGVPVAIVNQIPNQPLFDNLKEDDLIAHTMIQFFESGNPEDVLLLPMAKSAVRAMDTVADLMDGLGNPVKEFIVSGASKRGWTTYLAAAVDERVVAAVPMVIDMLNIPAQMEKQKAAYGEELSPQIEPYTSRGVIDRIDSDEGRTLLDLVDPFAYRHQLQMPKLLLLGTNDPFWTIDAANVYFDKLPGKTYLHYVPNAGHGLNVSVLPTLIRFFKNTLSGQSLPEFQWQLNSEGALSIEQIGGAQLQLWQAHSSNLDFREANWSSKPIEGDLPLSIKPDLPEDGYLAFYVQANYPGGPEMLPYSFSSQVSVLAARPLQDL